jgi:Zn-finger nucleic acid-binding protein
MGSTRRSFIQKGGFRPCCRCGRRTFSLCEDCGRPTCPECATVEITRVGTSDLLHRMCPRCHFEYRFLGPPWRLRGRLDGIMATNRRLRTLPSSIQN